MKEKVEEKSMLGHYRVLDLADEKGFLCGMLLADMGADVIKVEPPDGDPARRLGPFYHDDPDPEKSLYWFAYNRNKRGITLNLETADGQELFKRLVKTADLVIESFGPGYMSGLGLGYPDLEKINPGLIMVSITDWGQTGPYVDKGYKADQMVSWALGGIMWLCGDPDRPPVQISFPHAYLHAAAQATVGALIALYHQEITGEGQQVDVSVQACLPYCSMNTTSYWELENFMMFRGLEKIGRTRADGKRLCLKYFWECQDGYMTGLQSGGAIVAFPRSAKALTEWMKEEGMEEDTAGVDWFALDMETEDMEKIQHLEDVAVRFVKTKTKAEFYDQAIKRKITFAPISDPSDIAHNPQFQFRNFYVNIEHPELGDTLTYMGPFAQFSKTPLKRWFPAPLIGQHNREVYGGELGLSKEQLLMLKEAKVI